jgi:hypothetical protein
MDALRKATKNSVRIAGLQVRISKRELPNRKQECFPAPVVLTGLQELLNHPV